MSLCRSGATAADCERLDGPCRGPQVDLERRGLNTRLQQLEQRADFPSSEKPSPRIFFIRKQRDYSLLARRLNGILCACATAATTTTRNISHLHPNAMRGERESGRSPVDFQTVGVESQTKEATSESHLHCNPSDEGARKNKIKSSKSHSARADDARLPRFSWVRG